MKPVIFQCPINGMGVQWLYRPHVPSPDQPDEDIYETVDCPACGGVHLFNRVTGTLGISRPAGRGR